MNNSFFRNLFRAGFVLVFLCVVSVSVQAQTLSTQAEIPALQLTDDYSIRITANGPVETEYQASVYHYAANMPDQSTADSFMDQFERDYATITVDLPNLEITLTLEMNATTSLWTVEQWNQHLKTN